MTGFHDIQFPTDISYGVSGGSGFNTTILTLSSGKEQRRINWSQSKGQWDAAQGVKTQAQMSTLITFFNARYGRAYSFRYKDWSDFQLPFPGDDIPTQFTTDGSTATFQITKPYIDAAGSYLRPLKKIVAGTTVLYDNGVLSSDWSADITTGIVTLGATTKATTGHAIGVTCEFDVPTRFDTDDLKAAIVDFDNLEWSQIPLVEDKL